MLFWVFNAFHLINQRFIWFIHITRRLHGQRSTLGETVLTFEGDKSAPVSGHFTVIVSEASSPLNYGMGVYFKLSPLLLICRLGNLNPQLTPFVLRISLRKFPSTRRPCVKVANDGAINCMRKPDTQEFNIFNDPIHTAMIKCIGV